jgi:FkbM family methyltransferase
MEHPYLRYYTIQPNDFILDMGATTGDFGQEIYSTLVEKGATILCVEPSSWSFKKLAEWARGKPNVEVIQAVVSDHDGEEEIVETDQAMLHYLSRSEQHWDHQIVNRHKIASLSLPSIAYRHDINISFIKCDVEGAEKFAFSTLTDTSLVDNMAIASYHLVDGEMTWIHLQEFFKGLGYYTLHENIEGDIWSDMLYVSIYPLGKE